MQKTWSNPAPYWRNLSRSMYPSSREDLIVVLLEARALLSRQGNDFSWSSWEDERQAVGEIDTLLLALRSGHVPRLRLEDIFAPTGPMQEVSLSSGWPHEFLDLAKRFDDAIGF